MKFTKGIIIGSVITAGIIMMCADDNMNTKKMMIYIFLVWIMMT